MRRRDSCANTTEVRSARPHAHRPAVPSRAEPRGVMHMGAGARFAEERGRWADHWRIVDLDQESEHLLDNLDPDEELRAAVPGRLRTTGPRGVDPVLIGVTDRRVLVVGPSMPGGMVELDLDPSALARLREHADGLGT